MNFNIKNVPGFSWVSRVYILYVLFFCLAGLKVVKLDGIADHMRITTLNRRMPSYAYYIRFHDGEAGLEPKKLEEQVRYFKIVESYFPGRSDVHGFLGFSRYYLGQEEGALKSFEKAVELDPQFLWSQYDLGLIYFKKGDYERAAEAFKSAVGSRMDYNLNFIFSSKLYVPIVVYMKDFQRLVLGRFQRGYEDSFVLLTLSLDRSGKYQELFERASIAVSSKLEPQWFYAYYLGRACYELGKWKESAYFLRQSLELNPQNAEAYKLLGQVFQKIGQQPLADQILRAAEALKDSSVNASSLVDDMRLRLF